MQDRQAAQVATEATQQRCPHSSLLEVPPGPRSRPRRCRRAASSRSSSSRSSSSSVVVDPRHPSTRRRSRRRARLVLIEVSAPSSGIVASSGARPSLRRRLPGQHSASGSEVVYLRVSRTPSAARRRYAPGLPAVSSPSSARLRRRMLFGVTSISSSSSMYSSAYSSVIWRGGSEHDVVVRAPWSACW